MEEVDLQAKDVEEVEEMDMTQGMEMKRRMRMTLCSLLLKIQEKFHPEDWTDGSGEGWVPQEEVDPLLNLIHTTMIHMTG